MRLLKIGLLAVIFVFALSCSDKKSDKKEDKNKSVEKNIDSTNQDDEYKSDMVDESNSDDKSLDLGEPVPGAEIYLEQEPVGEE